MVPTGVKPFITPVVIGVGEDLYYSYSDIVNLDGVIPTDVEVWRDYIVNTEDGVNIYEDEDSKRFVFNVPGRYVISAGFGFNSLFWFTEIEVIVDAERYLENVSFNCRQRMSTMYTDKPQNLNVGDIEVENFPLIGNEEYQWSVVKVDEAATYPTEFFVEPAWENGRGASISTSDGGETPITGISECNIVLTIKNPASVYSSSFSKSYYISLNVDSSELANFPSGISVSQNLYSKAIGETLTLSTDDISFVDSFMIPEGETLWTYYKYSNNAINNTEVRFTNTEWSFTFNDAGTYTITACATVSSIVWTIDIIVTVQ